MNKRERYKEVCFSLGEKKKELDSIEVETFVYNPKAFELAKEVYELMQEKTKLEEEIGE